MAPQNFLKNRPKTVSIHNLTYLLWHLWCNNCSTHTEERSLKRGLAHGTSDDHMCDVHTSPPKQSLISHMFHEVFVLDYLSIFRLFNVNKTLLIVNEIESFLVSYHDSTGSSFMKNERALIRSGSPAWSALAWYNTMEIFLKIILVCALKCHEIMLSLSFWIIVVSSTPAESCLDGKKWGNWVKNDAK